MTTTYRVDGMTCGGCARSVTGAINRIAPQAAVSVDLPSGRVTVDGEADEAAIKGAVEGAGFDFLGRAD